MVMLALSHAFLSGTPRLQFSISLRGLGRAWRAEGARLVDRKKVHSQARSNPDKTGEPLDHERAGQSNLAQAVREAWSPSIPQSVARIPMMSSPWCRSASLATEVQGPPLSSTSTRRTRPGYHPGSHHH
jgi:hypothetical protein